MSENNEWLKLWFSDDTEYTGKYVKYIIDKYGIEEPMYYALIKGHELVDSYDIYWNVDRSDYGVFVSRLNPPHDNFITEMSKEAWNDLGIDETNAVFVKVDE